MGEEARRVDAVSPGRRPPFGAVLLAPSPARRRARWAPSPVRRRARWAPSPVRRRARWAPSPFGAAQPASAFRRFFGVSLGLILGQAWDTMPFSSIRNAERMTPSYSRP